MKPPGSRHALRWFFFATFRYSPSEFAPRANSLIQARRPPRKSALFPLSGGRVRFPSAAAYFDVGHTVRACAEFWARRSSDGIDAGQMHSFLFALTRAYPSQSDDVDRRAWCGIIESVDLMRSVVTTGNRARSIPTEQVDEVHLMYMRLLAHAGRDELIARDTLRSLLLGENGRTPDAGLRPGPPHTVKSFVRYVENHDTLCRPNLNTLAGLIAIQCDLDWIHSAPLPTPDDETRLAPRGACERSLGPGVAKGFGRTGRCDLLASLEASRKGSLRSELFERLKDFGFLPGLRAKKCAEDPEASGLFEPGMLPLAYAALLNERMRDIHLGQGSSIDMPDELTCARAADRCPTAVTDVLDTAPPARPCSLSDAAQCIEEDVTPDTSASTQATSRSGWATRVQNFVARLAARLTRFFGRVHRALSGLFKSSTRTISTTQI